MISSPCKSCKKKIPTKVECLKTCEMIQSIQRLQLARRESNVCTAVDFTEESRFQMVYTFDTVLNAW